MECNITFKQTKTVNPLEGGLSESGGKAGNWFPLSCVFI